MVKPAVGKLVLISDSRRDAAWVERSGHAPALVVHSNDDLPAGNAPIALPPNAATRTATATRRDRYVRNAFAMSVAAHLSLAGGLLWLMDRPRAATPVMAIEVVYAPQGDELVDNAGPDVLAPDVAAEVEDTPAQAEPVPQQVAELEPPPEPEPPPPPVAEAPPPEPTPEPIPDIVKEPDPPPPPPPEVRVEKQPEPPKPVPPRPKRPKAKPVKLEEPKLVPVAAPAPVEMREDAAPAKADTGLSTMSQQADAPPAAPVVSDAKVPQAATVPVITNPGFRRKPTPPDYPRRAKEMDQQGTVIVRALIAPNGSIGEIVVWRSSGYVLLDEEAKRAVSGWAFEPARVNGRTIEAWVELPINFRLH